jgi:hypothetical protein
MKKKVYNYKRESKKKKEDEKEVPGRKRLRR